MDPPSLLEVEHSDPVGEVIENGNFSQGYDPWGLTRLQSEGKAEWDENESNTPDGSGSIHIQAVQAGDGATTEESYWQQDIPSTNGTIIVSGAFNKSAYLQEGGTNLNKSIVEIQVYDTEEGWQTIYNDTDNSAQYYEWVEFGPNETYTPSGKVTSVRIYMYLEAEGIAGNRTARGDIWVDDVSVVPQDSDGDDHNLLTWESSADDPENVTHYNVYRSGQKDGEYEHVSEIAVDGSDKYQYIDEGKGRADETIWWYKVEAKNQTSESVPTGPVQEPGPEPPTDPTPADGAEEVTTYPELSVMVSHTEERNIETVTFHDASDDRVLGSLHNVSDAVRTGDVVWEGLERNESYEWYVVAEEDGVGSVRSDTWSFTTSSEAPAVRTLGAKNITTDSAELRGEVTSLGDVDQVDAYFRWRREESPDWTETEVQTINTQREFKETIDGLNEKESYEFQAVIRCEYIEEFGGWSSFTTLRGAFFKIEVIDYDQQVVEGEEFEVDFEVENVGDLGGAQNIRFTVRDDAENKVYSHVLEDLELRGGETYEEGNFSWSPEDTGEYSFEIASESDNYTDGRFSVETAGSSEGGALADGNADEIFLDEPWSYLMVVLTALVIIAGGVLYKRRTSESQTVIEEVFLISERNSMLIQHETRRLKPNRDSDIIAGMFESVQKFIQDSFQDAEDWELNRLEFGDNSIVVERGRHVYMAVVYKGEIDEKEIQKIRDIITEIEDEFGEQLKEWDGDAEELEGIKDIIKDLFS